MDLDIELTFKAWLGEQLGPFCSTNFVVLPDLTAAQEELDDRGILFDQNIADLVQLKSETEQMILDDVQSVINTFPMPDRSGIVVPAVPDCCP